MKVLVVEDSLEAVETIRLCLTIRWPHATVVTTGTASEAVHRVESESPDLVVLDLALPDGDGLAVLREIRQFSSVPVIIVTGRAQETDRVRGLELGADDYIVKPFLHTELLARVRAVLRRTQAHGLWRDDDAVRVGDLVVDQAARRVLRNGVEVHLTATEWHLLAYLLRNEGRVVSAQTLAEKVWGSEEVSRSAIAMSVRRLRLKLGDDPQNPQLIRSHRGLGYSFTLNGD